MGVMILSFFKGLVKSPVLHNTRDGSEFYVPYLLHYLGGGLRLWLGWEEGKEESKGGSIPVYYETCLKTQPAHKPLITRRGSFPLRGLLLFFQLTISPSDFLALI